MNAATQMALPVEAKLPVDPVEILDLPAIERGRLYNRLDIGVLDRGPIEERRRQIIRGHCLERAAAARGEITTAISLRKQGARALFAAAVGRQLERLVADLGEAMITLRDAELAEAGADLRRIHGRIEKLGAKLPVEVAPTLQRARQALDAALELVGGEA